MPSLVMYIQRMHQLHIIYTSLDMRYTVHRIHEYEYGFYYIAYKILMKSLNAANKP